MPDSDAAAARSRRGRVRRAACGVRRAACDSLAARPTATVRRQRGRVRQQRGDAAVACGVRRATHQTQWKTQGSQSLSDSVTLSQRHSVIGSPNFTQLHGVHAAKFTVFTRFTASGASRPRGGPLRCNPLRRSLSGCSSRCTDQYFHG